MTIENIISAIDDLNEEAVIYAKKIGGRFLRSSEAVVWNYPKKIVIS